MLLQSVGFGPTKYCSQPVSRVYIVITGLLIYNTCNTSTNKHSTVYAKLQIEQNVYSQLQIF